MTFDDVRKFALTLPDVEDGSSYGTPALKVRKKMLARPNRTPNFSAANYAVKAARWKALWPEIAVDA